MPSPIRLLYVITDLELGGVPLHLFRLAREMRGRGFEIQVASLAPPGPVGEMMRQAGIEVVSCRACCGWDVRVFKRLARIMAAFRPDVVHSLLFHANLASRWAARRAGIPADRIVCEIQTVEVERRWHLWADRFTHRGCRFTIGNSPAVVAHLRDKAGMPEDRLRLVRGGIDPTPFADAAPVDRASLGVPAGARMVLWVGRLDPVKGLELLVDAVAPLVTSFDAHLVLVGGGPLHGRLARKIEDTSLGDRVHLAGPRNDVASLLKSADVFAFPSRTEGLPNALLEAMAAGCAIVTTDVPGCRDLIDHDVSGLRVPYGDTAALRSAIAQLLRDSDTARRLGGGAQEAVIRNWHVEATYAAYEEVYREATPISPAGPGDAMEN